MKQGRVGVIGGGLGGLAAACTLAARGYAVVLFEKSPWLGGKAAVLEADGYRFDMGPTILTLPSVLRRVFAEAGRRLEDALSLVPLDPQWRSFFVGGSTLDLCADVGEMGKRLDAFAPGDSADGYRAFLDLSAHLHDISDRYFFWRSIGSVWDMMDPRTMFKPSMLADLVRMRLGRSVARTVRAFVPEPRVAQMLDHFTQYVGSAPDASPAVLCGIAHMQTSEGVWYPVGGTGAVPRRSPGWRPNSTWKYAPALASGASCWTRPAPRPASRPIAASAYRWRRSSPTPTPCARIGSCWPTRPRPSASSAAGATNRPAPASSYTSVWTALTTIWPTITSFFHAIRRKSSTPFTAAASRPRTRLVTSAPGADGPERRPARRRGALRPGPHAVSATPP